MDNYEHEIKCPEDNVIYKYLWFDYFHDSKINNISFNREKCEVMLTIECTRDINDMWNKINGTLDNKQKYIDEHMDTFIYNLSFRGAEYFHIERLIVMNDYLSGRFKDTALLRKLSGENKSPLYHYRIQIDDGYMEIIFSNFNLRKKTGRVKYSIDNTFHQTQESVTSTDIKEALNGDDSMRFKAMQKLYKANAHEISEIARKNINFEDYGDSCLYSAFLLGKFGNLSDIPSLMELYLNIEEYLTSKSVSRCSTILPKRNILDAIELIKFRNQNE